jgi:hypothetical protein
MVEYSTDEFGVKRWTKDGFLHREDGPAVEYPDGTVSFWLYGIGLNLDEQMKDIEFRERYPKLIESMIIESIHES